MKKADNRSLIILLVVSTIFWFLLDKSRQIHLTVVLNAILLLYIGEGNKAVKLALVYAALILAAGFFARRIALMYIILNMSARSIPLVMLVTSITAGSASELADSLQKLKIPKSVIVMICVMIRFFPVLNKEIVSIGNGMKARGIFSGWWDYVRRPVLAYECLMIPLLIRCLKLSDELGATAELRGLNAENDRTCIYEPRLGLKDGFVLIVYGAAIGWIYFGVR